MVTNFALSLSFDGIALLRRTGDVWAQIQEVPLDSGDLDAAILGLRNRAEGLDPSGAQVTLIIPNEQIRYLEIPDPGGNPAAQDLAVRAALDGATPYQVADLVYDFVNSKGSILIAAVAKETLAEAEGFAQQNGFEPVDHAAQAPSGQFDGAVFFGAASTWAGPVPARLAQAVVIVPADAAALEPLIVMSEAEPEPELKPEPEIEVEAAPDIVVPEPPAETDNGDTAPEPDSAPADAVVEQPAKDLNTGGPQAELDLPPPATAPLAETKPIVEPDEAQEAKPPVPASEEPAPAKDATAADASVAATSKKGDGADQGDKVNTADKDQAASDDAAPPVAFSTIRASREGQDVSASPKGSTKAPKTNAATQIKPRFTPVATPEARVKEAGVTVPSVDQGAAAQAKAKPKAEPAAPKVARPKAAGPVPSVKPATPPLPTTGADQAPAAPVAESALARLAALRARTEPVSGDGPPAGAPALKAEKGNRAAQVPVPPSVTPPAHPAEQVADARTPELPSKPPPADTAKPESKSPLSRLAALRSKPDADPTATNEAVAAAAAASLTAQSERDRMTVFGARNQPKIGGKPRFLGLLLTAGLLLFMAGVAAWASVFLDDGLAGLFRSEPKEVAIASAPQIVPQAVAENPVRPALATDEPAAEVQLAALDTGLTTAPDNDAIAEAPKPRSIPREPRMLSPEEAAATYAATGIWQRAPVAPLGIETDGVDDVYVASIDPKVQESDAVALPDPNRFEQDPSVEAPGLPPAAGQVFDMDARGLVRATPEGAMSPDGIRVYAGLPPAVPPERTAASPTEQAPAPEINDALRTFRPKLRPDNLIEERERATLSGRSRAELATLRPLMRPKTAQEVAVDKEPEAIATAQAVGKSLTPVGRPRNMVAIVKRAEPAAPAQAVRTAAIAPRTVTPAAPSSRGVAQSATVRNAINLNKISLIGVYGTPAQRRALVRLPNGKYKKVKVGDQLDGGRVAAIGDAELRYTKSGRNVSLKMPRS